METHYKQLAAQTASNNFEKLQQPNWLFHQTVGLLKKIFIDAFVCLYKLKVRLYRLITDEMCVFLSSWVWDELILIVPRFYERNEIKILSIVGAVFLISSRWRHLVQSNSLKAFPD